MKFVHDKHSGKAANSETIPTSLMHDLNNVLSTIEGSTEIILASAGDDINLRVQAARILRASRDGVAMIENLNAADQRRGMKQKTQRPKRIPQKTKNSA